MSYRSKLLCKQRRLRVRWALYARCLWLCSPRLAIAALVSMTLSACMNLSGLDGSSQYGCQAPEGVKCESVSGTYYNALKNNLPSQRSRERAKPSAVASPPVQSSGGPRGASQGLISAASGENRASQAEQRQGPAEPVPLRSPGKVLGMWFKPWRDADGDLFDEGRVYIQVDSGEWMVEHVRQRIRNAYAPIRGPRSAQQGSRMSGSDRPNKQSTSALLPGRSITDAAKALQAADKPEFDDGQ